MPASINYTILKPKSMVNTESDRMIFCVLNEKKNFNIDPILNLISQWKRTIFVVLFYVLSSLYIKDIVQMPALTSYIPTKPHPEVLQS